MSPKDAQVYVTKIKMFAMPHVVNISSYICLPISPCLHNPNNNTHEGAHMKLDEEIEWVR